MSPAIKFGLLRVTSFFAKGQILGVGEESKHRLEEALHPLHGMEMGFEILADVNSSQGLAWL